MEHQKILNLLNEANDFKFVTRKWNIVNNLSNTNYDIENEIIYNTKVLKSNLCDCNDAYILVRGDITITAAPVTLVSLKHCAPFNNCIAKINGTTIDDAEDLDLVMPMYILIECSSNYSQTTGGLWFYSKDEGLEFKSDDIIKPKAMKFIVKKYCLTISNNGNVLCQF